MTRSRPLLLALLSGILGQRAVEVEAGGSRGRARSTARRCRCRGARGCRARARFWRASSAVSPTTTRQPGRIWMVVGRTPSRRGGLQPFIEATPSRLLLLQQDQQQNRPRGLQSSSTRSRSTDRPCRTARTPDFPCFIRSRSGITKFPHRKTPNPLKAADARDSTTRLWQLRGCYLEIAGLPAPSGGPTRRLR